MPRCLLVSEATDFEELPRVHAFHPPFNPRQFVPWLCLALSYACFFGLCVPKYNSNWQIWTICYCVATLLVFISGMVTTYFISPHASITRPRTGSIKCERCALPRSRESRTHHCSYCNRCADDFDHRKFVILNITPKINMFTLLFFCGE